MVPDRGYVTPTRRSPDVPERCTSSLARRRERRQSTRTARGALRRGRNGELESGPDSHRRRQDQRVLLVLPGLTAYVLHRRSLLANPTYAISVSELGAAGAGIRPLPKTRDREDRQLAQETMTRHAQQSKSEVRWLAVQAEDSSFALSLEVAIRGCAGHGVGSSSRETVHSGQSRARQDSRARAQRRALSCRAYTRRRRCLLENEAHADRHVRQCQRDAPRSRHKDRGGAPWPTLPRCKSSARAVEASSVITASIEPAAPCRVPSFAVACCTCGARPLHTSDSPFVECSLAGFPTRLQIGTIPQVCGNQPLQSRHALPNVPLPRRVFRVDGLESIHASQRQQHAAENVQTLT